MRLKAPGGWPGAHYMAQICFKLVAILLLHHPVSYITGISCRHRRRPAWFVLVFKKDLFTLIFF